MLALDFQSVVDFGQLSSFGELGIEGRTDDLSDFTDHAVSVAVDMDMLSKFGSTLPSGKSRRGILVLFELRFGVLDGSFLSLQVLPRRR